MATIFTEPLAKPINYTQWEQLIRKTTFEAGGFIALSLTNMNSTAAPRIAQGSRVEVGGSLYLCTADETVPGTPEEGQTYVYCVPGGSVASFIYSSTTPAWNAVKGGWYNGSNRAVAKLFYSDGQYNGKVILDSYNAIRAMNTEQPVPTTGGVQVITGVVNSVQQETFPAGVYRYEIRAGSGGKGGDSWNGVYTGGGGAAGESKSGTFLFEAPVTIHYALGGNGAEGEQGYGDDPHGPGGGGCSGGSAFIDTGDNFILCLGGSGGGGGSDGGSASAGAYGGGGGGGGGYGAGGNGKANEDGYGRGGSNGYGGAGGYGTASRSFGGGGGGSGFNGGGAGGGSGGGAVGASGGGYGGTGGKGGDGNQGAAGGQGGGSRTGETNGPVDKYTHRIQYQGGGGGGGGKNYSNGGWGGSGVYSTSSGYLRIYRMW